MESARRALAGESITTTIELDGAVYEIRSSSLQAANGGFTRMLSNARAYVYRCRNEPLYPNDFASDYALELTGYSPEDLLLGGPVSFGELIVEEDRGRVWEEVQGALKRGERYEVGYSIRRRDGRLRRVEDYGQGVYGEGERS